MAFESVNECARMFIFEIIYCYKLYQYDIIEFRPNFKLNLSLFTICVNNKELHISVSINY